MNTLIPISAIAIIALVGCDERRPARRDVAIADSFDSQTVVLIGRNLAANLMAYMERLEDVHSAQPETLRRRLPIHARMLTEVLAQYEREMTILDVTGGRAWKSTVDSVRNDLSILQQVNDRELRPVLEAHQRRVANLITYHEAMLRAGGDLNPSRSGGAPVERRRPN